MSQQDRPELPTVKSEDFSTLSSELRYEIEHKIIEYVNERFAAIETKLYEIENSLNELKDK